MSGIQLGANGDNDISNVNHIEFINGPAPARSIAGNGKLYRKNDAGLYWKPDATGEEYDLTNRPQLKSLINIVNILVENHNTANHEVHTLNPSDGNISSYPFIAYFGGGSGDPKEVNGQKISFNNLTTANFSDGLFTTTGRFMLLLELEFGTDTDADVDWIIQIGSGGVLTAQGTGQTTTANETNSVTISGVVDAVSGIELIVAFQSVDNSFPSTGLLFGPSGVAARSVTIIPL